MDASGNLYFTSQNCVFRLDTSGVLTLVAGNSRPGYSGDGGPATAAQFNQPEGVAVDPSGNVYVADSLNSRIRMISSSGIVTTIGGNGTAGYSGDRGLASAAQFNLPAGIALSASGDLYVADTGNNVIREITVAGTIITFAGIQYGGYSGDGAAATAAQLAGPTDVAIDAGGNVYIADTENNLIRRVTTDGNINTIAGSQSCSGTAGAGTVATNAILDQPHGITVDSAGNYYISDYGDSSIQVVNTRGIINTVAGNGTSGFSGDGGPALNAQLAGPWGVTVDSNGNLYIADLWNYRIRKRSSSGAIGTVAGNGVVSYSGDGGAATGAQLNGPAGVAVDKAGNVYIADTANNRVRQVTAKGVIDTLAGNGAEGSSGDGGQPAGAQLSRPQAVAVDSFGDVYIADTLNNRVREVFGGVIATLAGTGSEGYSGDGGPAANAKLNGPRGVAVDSSGNVYVADFNNNAVRKISNGAIVTVAGNGSGGFSGDKGPAAAAQLNGPAGVAVDAAGDLYIADSRNYRLRMVTPDGNINTIAGNGTSVSTGDGGPAANAQLSAPDSVAVDSAGNIYLADSGARIRKIAPDGTIATIAGKGAIGYSGDGGPALSAQLNGASGLTVDAAFNVYVADSGNNAIRMLQPSANGLTVGSVTNGASLLSGPIAPGEIAVLFGSGLGPTQLTVSQPNPYAAATELAGTRVLFNGAPARIIYTWTTQVAVVVPSGISGPNAQVIAQYQNQTSTASTVPVAATAPGLFTSNSSGQGQAVAINQNGSLNGAASPAAAGSTMSLLATGTGQAEIQVTIGGQPATVQSVGPAPGVAGVMEIAVQIPSGLPAGAIPVIIQAAGASTQTGVTIAVSGP